jgi:hypothetical protein
MKPRRQINWRGIALGSCQEWLATALVANIAVRRRLQGWIVLWTWKPQFLIFLQELLEKTALLLLIAPYIIHSLLLNKIDHVKNIEGKINSQLDGRLHSRLLSQGFGLWTGGCPILYFRQICDNFWTTLLFKSWLLIYGWTAWKLVNVLVA